MATEDKGFDLGMIAPAVGPVAAGLYGLFGPSRDTLRKEQLEDQQKFTDMQSDANKGQAQFTSDLQYEMWNKTNYEAQMEHIKNAGLNPALLYGKGGGGGATTGNAAAAGVSGGQASSSAATEANKIAQTLQIAQLGNIAAQTEKTKAETENIKAGTEKTGVETEIGKNDLNVKIATYQEQIENVIAQSKKASADAGIADVNSEILSNTARDQIKEIQEKAIGAILTNKQTQVETRKTQAEAAIEEFEAQATKNGISTKAPWYIKLMSSLYDRVEQEIK